MPRSIPISILSGLLPWASVNKTGSSLGDLDTRSVVNLSDFPSQTGQSGKVLTTSGSALSWMTLSADATPSGAIIQLAYSPASMPTGYLACNGAAISRSTYSALFTVIGTTYGVGDGSTTFNLPDLRGVFLRGLDDGKGYDTGRAIGTYQADDLKSHSHYLNWANGNTNNGVSAIPNYVNSNFGTINTSSTGGTETRPKNVAVFFAIKF